MSCNWKSHSENINFGIYVDTGEKQNYCLCFYHEFLNISLLQTKNLTCIRKPTAFFAKLYATQHKVKGNFTSVQCSDLSLQVILFEIDCTNLYELFCQFISWTNWVNSGKFMDNCWISCQVMADMKKVYDDLIIINL